MGITSTCTPTRRLSPPTPLLLHVPRTTPLPLPLMTPDRPRMKTQFWDRRRARIIDISVDTNPPKRHTTGARTRSSNRCNATSGAYPVPAIDDDLSTSSGSVYVPRNRSARSWKRYKAFINPSSAPGVQDDVSSLSGSVYAPSDPRASASRPSIPASDELFCGGFL